MVVFGFVLLVVVLLVEAASLNFAAARAPAAVVGGGGLFRSVGLLCVGLFCVITGSDLNTCASFCACMDLLVDKGREEEVGFSGGGGFDDAANCAATCRCLFKISAS